MKYILFFILYIIKISESTYYDFDSYKENSNGNENLFLQEFYDTYYIKNRTDEFIKNDNTQDIYSFYKRDNQNIKNDYYRTKRGILKTHKVGKLNSYLTYQLTNEINERKTMLINDLLLHYKYVQYEPLIFETRKPYSIHSRYYRSFLTWHFDYSNIYYTNYYSKINKISSLLSRAFKTWELYISLNFTKVDKKETADILVSFQKGRHEGDNNPFDGKGGILAHANFPDFDSSSFIHFDLEEDWFFETEYKKNSYGVFFIETAIHEIGHTLGLKHNVIPFSIMSPFSVKNSYYKRNGHISNYDIRNIQFFYGVRVENNKKIYQIMEKRQNNEDNEENIFLEFKKKKILDNILNKLNNLKDEWKYNNNAHIAPFLNNTLIDQDMIFLCNKSLDSLFFIDNFLHITYNDIIWRQSEGSKTEFLLPNKIHSYFKLNINKTRGIYIYDKDKYVSVLNSSTLQIFNLEKNDVKFVRNTLKIKTLTTQYLDDENINVIALLENNTLISFKNQYPIVNYKFENYKISNLKSMKTIFSYLKYIFFISNNEFLIYNIFTEDIIIKSLNYQPWLNCGISSKDFNDLQVFFDSNIYKKIVDYK